MSATASVTGGDTLPFVAEASAHERETGSMLAPRFDANGLVACIAVDDASGDVLMMAHMNAEALKLTLETGEMHYWSRSRSALWRKGATSGQVQHLVGLYVDCDQDALLARVRAGGDGGACHLGQRSCFHRRIEPDGAGGPARLVLDPLR
jgi:phosphoribosyl-AMP cyclohydrolase